MPQAISPSKQPQQGKSSIIITAYNSREFLNDTLDSATNQNFSNFEIIVVDDGSEAEHAERIRSIVAKYNRAKLIVQKNQGLSAARNTGARHANGEFLTFLDHDDIWEADFLTKSIDRLNSNEKLGAAFCRAEHMTTEGQRTGRTTNPKLQGLKVKDFLISDPLCCGSSFVVKRSAFDQIEGFDPLFLRAETPEICIRLLLNGWLIEGINDVLVYYRNTPGGLTSGNLLRQYRVKVLEKALRLSPELGSRYRYLFLIWLNQQRIHLRRKLIR